MTASAWSDFLMALRRHRTMQLMRKYATVREWWR